MSTSCAEVETLAPGEVLASMPPGVELASLLAAVTPALLDDDGELLEVVAGWDRLISWAHANQAKAVAEFGRRPWVIGDEAAVARAQRGELGDATREFADDELAARLSISPAAAGYRLVLATDLAGVFTATAAALEAGTIDIGKARCITEGCRYLDRATAAEVEAQVLGRASDQTTSRLRQAVRRAAIKADPVAARGRCQQAKAERGVWLTPLDDELAELRAVLPAADALTVHNVLSAAGRAAKAAGDESRTMAQLRADFLVAPFSDALASGELAGLVPTTLATHRGTRGHLQLTVPASVIMGVSNSPGELAGYGPITAELARELAADCTWRRIITNPVDGTFMSADTESYRPPAAMARHVETRDQTCRFRGCHRPANRCHLDHTTAYPGGRTCHGNLGPLCEHHHLFKHALDKSLGHLRQPSPGTFEWTMPTGHTYTTEPPALAPPIKEEIRCAEEPAAEGTIPADPPDDCPF